jgi:hypothetical protein
VIGKGRGGARMVHARNAANALKAFLSISSNRIAPDASFLFCGKLYILVQPTLKTRAGPRA